jgi:anti-anti-sigma regulatory factor
MFDYRRFTVDQRGDVTVVRVVDPRLFDTMIVTEFEDDLLDLVDMHLPQNVLIDFGAVTHCSTAVINGLLRAKKRLVARKGQLALCGMTDSIREAYRTLNLDGTVFAIYDNESEALAAF